MTLSPVMRSIVIPADLDQLQRLARWTEEFAQSAKLPSDLLFAIQLCIEEAVANVIMHSGAAELRQKLLVELIYSGAQVLAIIEDGGRSFDPTIVPPRHKPVSLEEATVGEFGIQLMRGFAEEMRYERHNGRNRLTLKFGQAA
jgi:anti-sigma regulatory factor (Ser/Thr protein kinase)